MAVEKVSEWQSRRCPNGSREGVRMAVEKVSECLYSGQPMLLILPQNNRTMLRLINKLHRVRKLAFEWFRRILPMRSDGPKYLKLTSSTIRTNC
jgi:hypothetical protein